jgi:hypothetical protein
VIHGSIAKRENSLAQSPAYPLSFFTKLDVSDRADRQNCGMPAFRVLLELMEPRACRPRCGLGFSCIGTKWADSAIHIHF